MGLYQVAPNIKYYMNDLIAKHLERKKKLVTTKDRDYFFIIDGDEGSGKSYLCFQFAKFLDSTFNLSRICFTPDEFLDAVQKATKGQAVVYDEAFTGFSSRGSMTEINKALNETIMECRKKNLFVFIVLPSIFFLDRTIVLHRGRVLFHCYFRKEKRGHYSVYNKWQLKRLVLKGRASMDYLSTKPKMRAKFFGHFALDKMEEHFQEDKYSAKKINMIKRKTIGGTPQQVERTQKHIMQRNILLKMLAVRGIAQKHIERTMKLSGVPIAQQNLSMAIKKANKYFKEDKEKQRGVLSVPTL